MFNNLEHDIQAYKQTYYAKNNKNIIFKNTQKFDCAREISSHFSIETLLESSVYIIPNSNFIYIDYTLVKHYLCPDNYNISHKYFIQLHEEILKTYSHFNICADLKSLTLTAIHRYMDLGKKVCALYLHSNKQSKQIDQIHIRNPPSFLQTAIKLFSPFISHDTLAKIRLV